MNASRWRLHCGRFVRPIFAMLVFGLIVGQAAADVTVSGRIRYEGAVGNEGDDAANALGLFPVRGAFVQIWDANTALPGHSAIAETYTADDGTYSFLVPTAETSHDPSTGSPLDVGNADFFLRIVPQSRPQVPAARGIETAYRVVQAGPVDGSGDDTVGSAYVYLSPTTENVAASYVFDHDFNAGANLDHAFSVFDGLTSVSRHYTDLTGNVHTSVLTLFPTNESTSNFSNDRLHVLQGDRFDWDVVSHELAHGIAELHPGIDNSPGGSHSSGNNLRFQRMDLNRRQANQLAWSEGFATYFGQVAQASEHVAELGIQRTADAIYHDNGDADGVSIASGLRYGIENAAIGSRPSRGEDNEATVSRILYDLFDDTNDAADRDRVTLDADKIWRTLISPSSPIDTLDRFWDVLVSPLTSNREIVDVGAIFQAHNVSPQPDPMSVHGDVPVGLFSEPPTFRWTIPQGGTATAGYTSNLLNDFGVKVFTDSFALEVYDSGLLGNVTEWTPGVFAWSTIAGGLGEGRNWIVYGIDRTMETEPGPSGATFVYETGPFWSDAVEFTLTPIPEPSSSFLAVAGMAGIAVIGRRGRRFKASSE